MKRIPHWVQISAEGVTSCPHEEQYRVPSRGRWPQATQNSAVSASCRAQFRQYMMNTQEEEMEIPCSGYL
jgi:hypothetical protein